MPLFSVVIPTYNREVLVGATLDSLFSQENQDFEVVIVDDGSTDGTLGVVRGYADRHPGRVNVLEQDHRGCAAARNRGAEAASGEYLAFLDSDDLWFPWTLRVAARVIEENDRPAMAAFTLFVFKDEQEAYEVQEAPLRIEVGDDFFSTAMKSGFALGVAHTVCRREAYLKCGGCLEENINGTDSDVLFKMGMEPGFVRIHEPPLLAYRRHDGSVSVNMEKGYGAVQMMLNNERDGVYPGGPERRRQRLEQILIRVRAISVSALRRGRPDLAWKIYRQSFWLNAGMLRARYLTMFPLLALSRKLLGKG